MASTETRSSCVRRLLGVLERVDGQPVRERQGPAPSTLGVELGGVVEHRGEPALHRRRLAGGADVLALVRALAGVLRVGRLDRVGVPFDADREGEQPARHVGAVLAAGMPASLGDVGVAVDDVDGALDLGAELFGHRLAVGVLGLVELLLGNPHAVDEHDRRVVVVVVVGGERVVERRSQDRVDADHPDAEVAHALQPTVVLLARRGDLARRVAGGASDRGSRRARTSARSRPPSPPRSTGPRPVPEASGRRTSVARATRHPRCCRRPRRRWRRPPRGRRRQDR